jgi:recombinational DNA repair protein (RecF pathway)
LRVLLFLAFTACGCATSTKAALIEKGVADDRRRQEIFEATLEVLDRNPQYVDEFFAMTRKHHATLERFTVDETRALKDPKLARLNATYLRDQPEALQEVMEQILAHAEDRPGAQKALADAMKSAFKDPTQRKTLKESMKAALKD